MTDPPLEINDVVAGYGDAVIVNGASMRVSEAEIVAILGANGAGKSTLLKVVVGLVEARAGTVRVYGTDVTNVPVERRLEHGIAYVPQVQNVFPSLTVWENLTVMLPARADAKKEVDRIIEFFPRLRDRLRVRTSFLSGGERQMLAMARVMIVHPRLVILDEPSAALSPGLVDEVFGYVKTVRDTGVPVLLVEQNVRKALLTADRAYVFENGRPVLEAPAAGLLEDPRVEHLFLGGHADVTVEERA